MRIEKTVPSPTWLHIRVICISALRKSRISSCQLKLIARTPYSSDKQRPLSTAPCPINTVISYNDDRVSRVIQRDLQIHENFLSVEEEKSIFNEVEPYLKRLRYEYDHWDNAIHGYRETERKKWSSENEHILQRVRDLAFPPGTPQIQHVHVLDLAKGGEIKPHIDAVRFCGHTIAGLSLLSSSVMRFVHEKDPSLTFDVLLRERSLYVMTGDIRYHYTHAILGEKESEFRGEKVPRDRRISVICRNESTDHNDSPS